MVDAMAPPRTTTTIDEANAPTPTRQGHDESGRAARWTSPWKRHSGWSIAVIGVALLTGCASSGRPLDDAQQRIDALLDEQSLPVTQIVLSDDRLFMVLDGGNELPRWELFPDAVEVDPSTSSALGMKPSDALIASILDRAEILADECSEKSYEAHSVAVSTAAMLTRLTCGEEQRGAVLNDRPLPVVEEGWTVETLTTVWDELLEVAPDGQFRQIGLYDGRYELMINPAPESGADCSVWWFRDLRVPSDSGALCSSMDGSEVFPTMDLRDIAPEDVYRALRNARAQVKIPFDAPPVEVTIEMNSEGRPSFYLSNGLLSVKQIIG